MSQTPTTLATYEQETKVHRSGHLARHMFARLFDRRIIFSGRLLLEMALKGMYQHNRHLQKNVNQVAQPDPFFLFLNYTFASPQHIVYTCNTGACFREAHQASRPLDQTNNNNAPHGRHRRG